MSELEFFHRQVQLWGEEIQLSLRDKKIAIIGSGGLGSSLAFALGASGIGQIHMIDFDDVSLHNIHRQIVFKTDDVGKNKAALCKTLIESRSPFVKAYAHECDLDEFMDKEISVDLIIDATDNLPTRAKIDEYAKKIDIPWLYGSVEAFHGQVCFFNKASFSDMFKITDRKPAGITAPIVMLIASFQANVALRYLAGLNIKKDRLNYLYFSEDGELNLQKFDLSTL